MPDNPEKKPSETNAVRFRLGAWPRGLERYSYAVLEEGVGVYVECGDNLEKAERIIDALNRASRPSEVKPPENKGAREWRTDVDVHFHEAHYEDDVLTRKCEKCGEDLAHPLHLRSGENQMQARKRYMEAYALSLSSEVAEKAVHEIVCALYRLNYRTEDGRNAVTAIIRKTIEEAVGRKG